MKPVALAAASALLFVPPALAHPGAHVHPHDGAGWLSVVSALAIIAAVGGLLVARERARR